MSFAVTLMQTTNNAARLCRNRKTAAIDVCAEFELKIIVVP